VASPAPRIAGPRVARDDFTRDTDLTTAELERLLRLTAEVKRAPGRYRVSLAGQYLGMLFEKPSLRTRLTFELAIKQLGGDAVVNTGPIGEREPVRDVARNMDRWTAAIVARTFSQKTVDELAHWAGVPVINALSDLYHPCQAIADLFTLGERFGRLRGLKLAFVGDGNNVAHSLMLSGGRLGVEVIVATPADYEPDRSIVDEARRLAGATPITVTRDPLEAVQGAHAVYTDVWASMGQERETGRRRKDFEGHQVHERLMARARPDAVFMHCLPARRGQETTDSVIESPQSVVFDQAGNRLHIQKALLLMLLS